ncbi:MAG: hypothetical protein NVS3B20_17940 [Polyangiales bacterium]
MESATRLSMMGVFVLSLDQRCGSRDAWPSELALLASVAFAVKAARVAVAAVVVTSGREDVCDCA